MNWIFHQHRQTRVTRTECVFVCAAAWTLVGLCVPHGPVAEIAAAGFVVAAVIGVCMVVAKALAILVDCAVSSIRPDSDELDDLL